MNDAPGGYQTLAAPARSEADLFRHRREFATLGQNIYANFGARGVMADAAIAAVVEALESMQSAGPGSRIGQALVEREMRAVREALGSCLGVSPSQIALVESVSHACAAALWGTRWRAGDHCLIGAREPPGTWIAARQLAARLSVELTAFDAGNVEDVATWRAGLLAALRPTTRLVLLSHIDWVTGAALPLLDVVETVRAGPAPAALVAIDGAQAVGALPLDLSNVDLDLYAVAGQKWLGGPDGVAALVVPRPTSGRLEPSFVGWRAIVASPDGYDIGLADDASRFEMGTAAFALLPGLREALRVADDFAPMSWRAARVAALTSHLVTALEGLAGHGLHLLHRGRHGIVSFTIRGMPPDRVVRKLEASRIIAKAHFYPPCTRLCVHYLTVEAEISAMIGALAEICGA